MKLKKINLKKGDEHNHPDIQVGRSYYLAKIDGQLYVGKFSREWYGLNFGYDDGAGVQFDTPGFNGSEWQALWKITQ